MDIHYKLAYLASNQLAVTVKVPGPCDIRFIYQGMQLTGFTCQSGDALDENDTVFFHAEKELEFSYSCELGFAGKHGGQGCCDLRHGAFEMRRAVMLPVPDGETGFHCVLHYRFPQTVRTGLSEMDIATVDELIHLSKHPVIYGSYHQDGNLYMEEKGFIPGPRELILFYENLFSVDLSDLKIFLLKRGTHVFGGAGNMVICASFDPDSLRDYELLSHRICHAALSRSRCALPMYAEEGVASYFELKSLEALPHLKFSLKNALRELYRRYLLFYLGCGYHLIPERETDYAAQPHLIEFLHYTQMPLIIAALDHEGKLQLDALESPYFHSDSLIALDFLDAEQEDAAEVLRELNEYCYLLYTWETHSQPDVKQRRLEAGPALFAPRTPEEQLCQRVSPTVFAQITRMNVEKPAK